MQYGRKYDMRVVSNYSTASLVINNFKSVSHTFADNISDGDLGLGVNKSSSHFKDFNFLTFP